MTGALVAPGRCDLEVEAILFDLDGVLVDSTDSVERLWRAFARRHGLDEDRLLHDLHGRRMVDLVARALPGLSGRDLDAEVARVDADEAADAERGTRPLPGALELTAVLAAAGAPWAIVTSGTDAVAAARIAAVGLPAPPVLVTADQVSAGKPAPEPYLVAARRLGVDAARCLVVEDAPSGVRAGEAAGATTAAVTTSHRPDDLRLAEHLLDGVDGVSGRPDTAVAGSTRLALSLACRRSHTTRVRG